MHKQRKQRGPRSSRAHKNWASRRANREHIILQKNAGMMLLARFFYVQK